MKRVLVTRPEPGASATARRLRKLGHEPVVLPLSRVVTLPAPDLLSDCDAVAVTSANALRHAPAELLRRYADKTCFVVGKVSAAAAQAAGFQRVETAEGDAASLAVRIAAERPGAIAFLTGRVRLPEFEERLRQAGVSVIPVELYDTLIIEPTAADLEALRKGRPIDAVLIYSALAAEGVLRLTGRPELAETFSATVHCVLSERISARLRGVEKQRVRIAARPEEAAILKLLES